MKHLGYLLISLVSLVLFACAGVEPSMMDTAQTLGNGKSSVSSTLTLGIQAPAWMESETGQDFDMDNMYPMQYWEVKYGLTDEVDLALRAGAEDEGYNAKFLVKKQLANLDPVSTAIVAGASWGIYNYDFQEFSENEDIKNFQISSAVMSMLLTRRLGKTNHITLAATGSYHYMKTTFYTDKEQGDNFYHAGLRLNFKKTMNPLYGMIELGFEAPLSQEDIKHVYPFVGLRAGWDFEL